ncbi:DUF262 domain-containing protein [Candidatus Venteria ishoeyi]|uniref:GmrSD restriction endonucleases N-terminal domain-containing protein n=1 Tax=Candidatus Venteria ishoeyi TaxID=1899563 RepID=A0A1H6FJ78_9GAMM|nr:DUF262 domain-containing protein [Candidatus Venteria ishoeyi]SEH09074.1 Uncharacterised protein [Candidatus Venteria ishoeyi]
MQQDIDQTSVETIEGLDNSQSIGWEEYPLDSVFVRTEQRTVSEVVKRIKAGRYELNPEFQRDFVWPEDKQSRLIESCLMRIPLPVFYVAEAKDGRIIVVDGLQRLTTFYRFMNNEFALSGLGADKNESEQKHPWNHQHFDDLPITLQERVEDTQLILYILDAKAPERAKLDIFERVNGGVPLTRQQMRNCLYNGQATQWLKKAANLKIFQEVTGGALDQKSMRDREAINRFCAFYLLGEKQYKESRSMDNFLAKALEKMNTLSETALNDLMSAFEHSMRINQKLFGKHAFRKSLFNQELSLYQSIPNISHRSKFNVSLFDVCSVLLTAKIYKNMDKAFEEYVRTEIYTLITYEDFDTSIRQFTNKIHMVEIRFSRARKFLENAIKNYKEGLDDKNNSSGKFQVF